MLADFPSVFEGFCCGLWLEFCCFGSPFWSYFGDFGLHFADFGLPGCPFGAPGVHLEPQGARGVKKTGFFLNSPPCLHPVWGPFCYFFDVLEVFSLTFFRGRFLIDSGVDFGSIFDDIWMLFEDFFLF